jgi:hypothetical protein
VAITFTTLGPTIGTGVDASSFSTGSWTANASALHVLFLGVERNSATPATPTVTHDGITATEITSLVVTTVGTDRRKIWIFAWVSAASPAAAILTADFGASHIGCEADLIRVDGSDVANGLVQTFVQTPNTGSDLTGTSGSITLSAAGDSNNRPICAFTHAFNENQVPRASWTEVTEVQHANPTTAFAGQFRSDAFETTASTTWTTSSAYGGIAAEIKVAGAGGGGGTVLDPFGMSGFFGG